MEESVALIARLNEATKMVLATGSANHITARTMSCIVFEGKIYFQTDSRSPKCCQLAQNPNVALCINNIQIEGVAVAIGHPLSKQNTFFAKLFEQYYPGSFKKYTGLADEVLFEVNISRVETWGYENGEPYQIFCDFTKETYKKEFYDIGAR